MRIEERTDQQRRSKMATDSITGEIEEILKNSQAKYKTVDVEKNLELEIDIGNLLVIDNNVIDLKQYRSNSDDFLKDLARDDAQLLINTIWKLPHERREDAIVVDLPAPKVLVPREKPLPKAAPLTKWEQYAKTKGIQKHKKSKKVWDEASKEWKPRWGYKRAEDETKDWLIEVPGNADPFEDQFAKKMNEKKERVSKNEYQRLRNIARASKVKIPKTGIVPTDNPSKGEATKALAVAKTSTASIGKFTDSLPNEKPPRNTGKKRKFEPLFMDAKSEKQNNMAILKNIGAKKPKLDVERAVRTEIREENLEKRKSKEGGKSKKSKRNGRKGRGGKQGPGRKGKQGGPGGKRGPKGRR